MKNLLKDKTALRRFCLGFFIAIIATSLDLFSKKMILDLLIKQAEEMQTNDLRIKLFDFFSLVYVKNKGISFGMFNGITNGNNLFAFLQGSIGLVVLICMANSKSILLTLALALIFGGAMGNVIDRILHGGVMDFLDFHIANYHWPAFNLADSFVFLGVLLMIFLEFFFQKPNDNH